MKHALDLSTGVIVVPCRVCGPSGDAIIRLALDTGATATLISWSIAVQVGYDPAAARRARITTGSTIEYCPLITVDALAALGKVVGRLDVLCHDLPPTARVDGLLGLNFLGRFDLRISFRQAFITLR